MKYLILIWDVDPTLKGTHNDEFRRAKRFFYLDKTLRKLVLFHLEIGK